ncbi:MAG: aminotransferase class V-fold PLP-dependent enzyme, partial [Propionibacteriaceae bacterium]|nr:aminotransferase class V-fold PLP-dependent enzyme [Propionibacteriaceae bacterium]
QPIAYGGGQERRLRSGTLSAPLLAAFAAALDQTVTTRDAEAARLRALSDRLVTGLAALDGVTVVGPLDPALRSPHIVNALFHGCLGEDLLLLLDAAGIACSTGAACTAGVLQPSHVLIALGYPAAREARWGLRFSFGPGSADGDVDAVLAALPGAIAAARASARAAGEWD